MEVTSKLELERMELTSQLEENLGPETARNLMSQIPPIDIQQLATKNDLTRLDNKIAELNTKFDAEFKNVDAEFKNVRSEMTLGFAEQSKQFAQLSRQFITLGFTLALPTWLGMLGLTVAIFLAVL